jgi:aryl-alcohol dehydrogenase (NADP+)
MAARGNRDEIIVGTKVGKLAGQTGLAGDNVLGSAHRSLERLQTDRIDLYYAHADDPETPLEESLDAFDRLVREGKVRYIGASNFEAPRLAEALATSAREGLVSYVAVQPEYNLVARNGYEGPLRDVCSEHGLGCFPYYGLASGFLTGKYRPGGPTIDSPRAPGAATLLDDRGLAVLSALDEISASHRVTVAAVALAWLRAQPTVVAPIASARSTEQLRDLLPGASLELAADELATLDTASAASRA